MDFNVITRLESHSQDLFRLGNRRLVPIHEGNHEEEHESLAEENKKKRNDVDERPLPPSRGQSFSSKATDDNTSEEDSDELDENEEERRRDGDPADIPVIKARVSKELVKAGQHLAEEEAKQGKRKEIRIQQQQKPKKKNAHYEDLWGAITRNLGKGFVLGYSMKVGVNSLYPLLNLIRGRRLDLSRKTFLVGAREYGLFFGSLLATFNGWMYETRKYQNEIGLLKRYRGFIAGMAAGSSLIWVPREKRWPIVLFSLVRTIELLAKLAVGNGFVPSFQHGDVMLMSLASASMLHSWIFHPQSLDPSYVGFLQKQSQVPFVVKDSLAKMYTGKPIDVKALNKKRAKMSGKAQVLRKPLAYDSMKPGEILHPTLPLHLHTVKFFLKAMSLAIPVYLPVFSIPILLFYPSVLIKKPKDTMQRVLSGVLRSSLFLSLYCTGGFCSVSLMRSLGLTYQNAGPMGQIVFMISGIIGGAMTIVEKKSRRIELALYVLSKAIEGRWNQAVQAGFKPWRNGDVMVFMFCFGVITHTFLRHPDNLRSAYLSILSRFFDTESRHKFYEIPESVSKRLDETRRNLSHKFLGSMVNMQDEDEHEHEEHQ